MVSSGSVTFIRGDLSNRLGQGRRRQEQSGAWISDPVLKWEGKGQMLRLVMEAAFRTVPQE